MITWDSDNWIDLGAGTEMTMQYNENHEPVGLIERHVCNGVISGGSVPFAHERALAVPSSPVWTVQQVEPLTLTPSIACHRCPHHGWIRDGRWVDA